jgi:hypothetical protein
MVLTTKITAVHFYTYFFKSKIAIYFHKGRPGYISLQLSKENIQYFKQEILFFYFCGSFALLDRGPDFESGSGSTDLTH